MSITRTIGGNRLGSGKKMTVDMKTYERSTHDLSYIWRSTMAPGTLTPFMTEVALPGDTFDIKLDCNVMTHPTVGPLFGSYKVQLDVFLTPIRLYQGKLHNNKLGIGLNMSSIKLPQIRIECSPPIDAHYYKDMDNSQINPSCIFSYLNIRGIGQGAPVVGNGYRDFNALPYLTYWDIYKNYYANKQEEKGAVIHNAPNPSPQTINYIHAFFMAEPPELIPFWPATGSVGLGNETYLQIDFTGAQPIPDQLWVRKNSVWMPLMQVFTSYAFVNATTVRVYGLAEGGELESWRYGTAQDIVDDKPQVYFFPLKNIDDMREQILSQTEDVLAFTISAVGGTAIEPYKLPLMGTLNDDDEYVWSKMTALEGLALKTYQSDLFNNWIQTEWIDGDDGINEITAIDTSGGSFTIDTLNLSKKVYDMLNRIAISGGSYNDWIETVYTNERFRNPETPMYMGGLIKELVFQEVISNSDSGDQPLGTLGGKGVMSKKHKGGNVTIKVDEPSYITGIVSLTPRLDYSQGNKWDVNLKTMDDFHKPALDEIGFQDLITDQMAWWDTTLQIQGSNLVPAFKSAGKQPAWINYMTNVNQSRGNFAIADNEMFMTLNRKYHFDTGSGAIGDLTTYIDPVKYNSVFAQTSRDAQNFWTQIGVDITARRKMSARIIPNL